MIGLGDVTVIESVGLNNGLDVRCEGMRGIKDVFESRMSLNKGCLQSLA